MCEILDFCAVGMAVSWSGIGPLRRMEKCPLGPPYLRM